INQHYIKNEPKGKSNASHKPEPDPQVNQFYKDAVKSIRHSGDKHIIFLEGIWDPDNLKKPSYYKDTAHNLVYEYHNYPTEANDSVKQSFDEKFKKFKKKIITFLVIWVNSIQDQWEKNLKHKMAI
ncbi:cellulase family glycosylhydrolase, partial [Staphylococcus epidermidis]|nr:cellulase family glycosylhydrolase [Staphylococcus epidermidis]